MSKTIKTLVRDIENVLANGAVVSSELVTEFGNTLSSLVSSRLSRSEDNERKSLRISNLGSKCDRKLWYSINSPELATPLTAATRFKFLIGDIGEALLLFLAKVSGHDVRHEQVEVDLHGVKGHPDCTIDSVPIDVKSASSYSFSKFVRGITSDTDDFGYLTQIDSYSEALKDDPLVNKETNGFLAFDKQHGHITLDLHKRDKGIDWAKVVRRRQEMVASNTLPPRSFSDVSEGASGNRKLGVQCSYCDFKYNCWNGLRAFLYSSGPVFLTHVAREPKVQEIF